jgi:AcrR family transcriptional regulator
MQNAILEDGGGPDEDTGDVATRIARQTLAARAPDYSSEVRRLLDAGREVMRRNGTTARARVVDIVSAAGLSNDAFYRHFASKDVLVAAILEDGTERLKEYLAHQMGKEATPEGQVRRWVEGVLAQATDEDAAATTLAVLWNASSVADQRHGPSASAPLATLLHGPFAQLGSREPELDASLIADAVVGRMSTHLWQGTRPSRPESDHLVAFCLSSITGGDA